MEEPHTPTHQALKPKTSRRKQYSQTTTRGGYMTTHTTSVPPPFSIGQTCSQITVLDHPRLFPPPLSAIEIQHVPTRLLKWLLSNHRVSESYSLPKYKFADNTLLPSRNNSNADSYQPKDIILALSYFSSEKNTKSNAK